MLLSGAFVSSEIMAEFQTQDTTVGQDLSGWMT